MLEFKFTARKYSKNFELIDNEWLWLNEAFCSQLHFPTPQSQAFVFQAQRQPKTLNYLH